MNRSVAAFLVVASSSAFAASMTALASCSSSDSYPAPPEGAPPSPSRDACAAPRSNSGYEALILAAKPIAYYRLGDSDGRARSLVEGPPEGTPTRGNVKPMALGAIHGDPNAATQFAGGRIDFGTSSEFDLLGEDRDFSLELWFRPDRPIIQDVFLLAKEIEQNPPSEDKRIGFALVIALNAADDPGPWIRFVRYSGMGKSENTGTLDNLHTILDQDDFYRHLVVTHRAGTYRMFLDGRLVDMRTLPKQVRVVTDASFRLGTDSFGNRGYRGRTDELAIYSRVLSDDEILAHYQAAASAPCGTSEGAVVCRNPDILGRCIRGVPEYVKTCTEGACVVDDGGARCGEPSKCL